MYQSSPFMEARFFRTCTNVTDAVSTFPNARSFPSNEFFGGPDEGESKHSGVIHPS